MATNQFPVSDPGDSPYKGIQTNDGGGSPTAGYTMVWDANNKRWVPASGTQVNPVTQKTEPILTPPNQGTGGGGGFGGGGLGQGGGSSAQTLPAGQSFAGTNLAPGAGSYPATSAIGSGSGGFWNGIMGMAGNNSGIDWAKLALGAYNSYENSRDPKFKDPGMTPEQRQLYSLYFASLTNPSLANNASVASNAGQSMLTKYMSAPGWQSPAMFGAGGSGYPGTGQRPNFSWSAPSGSSGATDVGSGMGAGGQNQSQGGYYASLDRWLSQHPEISQGGPQAVAAALSTNFGFPPSAAAKIAETWISSRTP